MPLLLATKAFGLAEDRAEIQTCKVPKRESRLQNTRGLGGAGISDREREKIREKFSSVVLLFTISVPQTSTMTIETKHLGILEISSYLLKWLQPVCILKILRA